MKRPCLNLDLRDNLADALGYGFMTFAFALPLLAYLCRAAP